MKPQPVHRQPIPETFRSAQETCTYCGSTLWISQHRRRKIHLLNRTIAATFRDSKCSNPLCHMGHLRYRPLAEATLALPNSSFGLDLLMAIGAMRLRDDFSFPRIHQRLRDHGVPISPMTVQNQFRNYLSLVSCQVGLEDGGLRARLRKQGAILPVIDGVQFGEGDPVLYLAIDALSRQPLFGRELFCRGKDDLVPFVAQLKELDIPILAVVSDKESALVPAISEALPDTPHQFCQFHYIKNAAKPMEPYLKELGAEVKQTEEALRGFQRRLLRQAKQAEAQGEAAPADLAVAQELCEAGRAQARRHGRAPFDPPALKRHAGLEKVAATTAAARRKKGGLGRISKNSARS